MGLLNRKRDQVIEHPLLTGQDWTALADIADALKDLNDILRGNVMTEYAERLGAKDKEIQELKSALDLKSAEEKKLVDTFKSLTKKQSPSPDVTPPKSDARTSGFVPPSFEEVKEYIESSNAGIDAEAYYDEMTKAGWRGVNGQPLKTWKVSVNARAGAKKAQEKLEEKERKFTAPSYDEVKRFADKIGSRLDPQYFLDYYNERAWMSDNGKPIVDWKAAFGAQSGVMKSKELHPKNRPYDYDECLKYFKSLGKPEQANSFWGYYASRDWKRNNGKVLKDWRQAARQWVLNQLRWDAEKEGNK